MVYNFILFPKRENPRLYLVFGALGSKNTLSTYETGEETLKSLTLR